MIKKGLAYTLIAIGFLVFLFFNKYTGTLIPYPFLFSLCGIAVLLTGVFLLRRSFTGAGTKLQQQMQAHIDHLKTNGTKIKVPLDDCELKEHHFTEERDRYNDRNIQAFNAWGGDPMKNVENVRTNQVVLIYNYTYPDSGETERFISPVIYKDRQSLLFYLSRQKETYIYVDPEHGNYYFDLDFLSQPLA